MRKIVFLVGLIVFFAASALHGQSFAVNSSGTNSWILSTPDSPKGLFFIAGDSGANWDWNHQVSIGRDSSLWIVNALTSSSDHAMLGLQTEWNNGAGGNPYISFNTLGTNGFAIGKNDADQTFRISRSLSDLSNPALTIRQDNGYVGIGTANPTEKFQVGDQMALSDGGWKGLIFNASWINGWKTNVSGYSGGLLFDTNEGYFRFWMGGNLAAGQPTLTNEVLTMGYTGNVGIGVTYPAYKLEVNGTIRAKEVIVEANNWPDYVFAKGAPQPSLASWEKTIAQEGHLPGMPSKAQAEKHGVSVGQMQKALLEKVEQLSLLLIQERKQNAASLAVQNKQITALQQEVTALKESRSEPGN